MKHDSGKARFDLIPAVPLLLLAKVFTHGAREYGDNNWRKGIKYGRVFAAIMRHLWAWWGGEDCDKETGLTHLAHAAWGCFALMHYTEEDPGSKWDDRPRWWVK